MAPRGGGLRVVRCVSFEGYPSAVPDEERRCPNCGALVSEDAAWCGQCFMPLRQAPDPPIVPRPAEPEKATAADAAAGATERPMPFWPCPVCGGKNPIQLDSCATCGTPFAQVMRVPDERARIEPRDAAIRSLIFPGLGHRAVGRGLDGLARGVLFAVTFGLGASLAVAAAGSGALVAAFILFLLAGIGVYAMSAVEAYGLAQGGGLLVETKVLMWALVGVVFVGVGLLVFGAVSAAHR